MSFESRTRPARRDADCLDVLLVESVLFAIALVPLLGGRLRGLASLRFRWIALLAVAELMQILALVPGSRLPEPTRAALQMGSYVVVVGFMWRNRRIPGLWLVIAGGLMNALVIAVNAGVMPATAHALMAAGQPTHSQLFTNSTVLPHPRLSFLGDVFWVPKGWPFSNVFSPGDALIAAGALATIHLATGSRLLPRKRDAGSHVTFEELPHGG